MTLEEIHSRTPTHISLRSIVLRQRLLRGAIVNRTYDIHKHLYI